MDAWEALIDNSTLDAGDAWDHLNAQGGGSGETVYVPVDAMAIAEVISSITAEAAADELEASIIEILTADATEQSLNAETTTTYEAEL